MTKEINEQILHLGICKNVAAKLYVESESISIA